MLYDPTGPGFPAKAHAVYREMRDRFPVYRAPDGQFYALSRFADVRAAAMDWKRFSSSGKTEALYFKTTLNGIDPPNHLKLRKLIGGEFSANRVARLEHDIRALTRQLIADFAGQGRCEIVGSFAALLPSMVTGKLLGVPPERWAEGREITDAIMRVRSPQDFEAPAARCYQLFQDVIDERRRHPGSDLMSALLSAEVDGERLSEDELLAFGFALLVGGNDTTASLIAGGLELLSRHTEARRQLTEDPALIPGAVEEMLRFASPTHATPRTATCDIEYPYGTIPAGARVILLWTSANHDEREFSDPERFDILRRPTRQLAFGFGPHVCIGARLARLEARIAFEELLPRMPGYQVTATPPPVISSVFSGFESLHLEFRTPALA